MLRPAGFTATVALVFCLCVVAQSVGYSASGTEVSASTLMERFSDMLDTVPAPPKVTEAEVVDVEDDDPETYIFLSAARAHPPEPVNFGGDGSISLTRQDSGEQLTARYRNRNGKYNQTELTKISRIMRCSLTGRETIVSIKLVELLDAIEDRFGRHGLILLSGYRTPTLNRRVPGAARRSLHMLGWAADIRVPGYAPEKVVPYARRMRAGGVGYYPYIGFTHLDVGSARHWVVRRRGRTVAPDKSRMSSPK